MRYRTEPGADGLPQMVIPGAEKAAQRLLLQRATEAPLRPKAIQRPLDCGLFSDEADQLDLVEMLQDPDPDDDGQDRESYSDTQDRESYSTDDD